MKGRWIEIIDDSYVRKCSVCGTEFPMSSAPHNFCSNCGMDMRRTTSITMKDFLALGDEGSWIIIVCSDKDKPLFGGYIGDFHLNTDGYIVDGWEMEDVLDENGDTLDVLWIYASKVI